MNVKKDKMIIRRLVTMEFKAGFVPEFKALFNENREKIRNFHGCLHLELWQDTQNPDTFTTYSLWESENALENYRNSNLFQEVWTLTKAGFNGKPRAASYLIME